MHDADGLLEKEPLEGEAVGPRAELSEADLECVVGGLARPWTETDADEWIVEPAPLL